MSPALDLPLAAERGFTFGDPYAIGQVLAGLAIFAAVVALSKQHERPFSAAGVYLLLGAVAAGVVDLLGLTWLDPFDDAVLIERLAEFAVIVALFAAGLKLDRPLGWCTWSSAVRLLALVMPLTIGSVVLFGTALMGLSVGAAVILGAVLAPTDPVLASDVQVGPPGEGDEPEPQFALTSEAGFNDGLAFPFVFLGLYIAGEGGTGWLLEWLAADVLYAIVAGVGLGALAGHGIAAAVSWLRRRDLLAAQWDGGSRSRPSWPSTARRRPRADTGSWPRSSAGSLSGATNATMSASGASTPAPRRSRRSRSSRSCCCSAA